jgi:hypothetical protein
MVVVTLLAVRRSATGKDVADQENRVRDVESGITVGIATRSTRGRAIDEDRVEHRQGVEIAMIWKRTVAVTGRKRQLEVVSGRGEIGRGPRFRRVRVRGSIMETTFLCPNHHIPGIDVSLRRRKGEVTHLDKVHGSGDVDEYCVKHR